MSYTDMRSDKLFPYMLAAKKGWLQCPVSLQVGTTHTCVNRCVMCQHWARDKKGPVKVLDVERFTEAVLAPFSDLGGETICYSGGESMEHPRMMDILAVTHSLGIRSGIITSGAGVALQGDLNILNQCQWVRVSLDAVTPEIYEKSRGPGYEEVMKNLDRMIKQGTRLGFGITVHKHNVGHLGEIVDFIIAKVPRPQIESIRFWLVRGESQLSPKEMDCAYAANGLIERSGVLHDLDTNMAEFVARSIAEKPLSELLPSDHGLRCVVPLVHLYIDASLRGYPCCIYAGDAEIAPLVHPEWNFAEQTLSEVYGTIIGRESEGYNYAKDKKACAGCTLRLMSINRAHASMQPERHFI